MPSPESRHQPPNWLARNGLPPRNARQIHRRRCLARAAGSASASQAPRPATSPHQAIFVPLATGPHVVGMLRLAVAATAQPPHWTPEEERLITAAAEQIGQAIEQARLRQVATEAEILRQTEEVRQAVLAAVSHDLHTPLASIQALAESLSQHTIQWTEDERYSFATTIVQETQRLNRLVENLLDMGRIEAGRLRPDIGWYPLDALMDDVLSHLEGELRVHRLQVAIPESLPPVPLDYVQISQVASNLVENAIKYTPPGTTIAITAIRTLGSTSTEAEIAAGKLEMVRVAVLDDGPGIPAASLPFIFDKFYRVSGGDQSSTRGTGLGLSVARGYVEAHGGRIEAHSPPPGATKGTVFYFWLPLHPPDQPTANKAGAA